ncbi:MAG: glycosyltransferase [Bryobacteraceae bacterium]|nr:glycosyltransferase [Bryobacteraceae bacterium]
MSPDTPQPEVLPPLVSVVIVSHNCREALERCLDAIARSTGAERIETLVVDAGSRDGSAEVDADRPWVQVIRMPMYFGRTRARNIGTRTARGDYIFFLDPRVEVQPGCILRLAETLENRNDAAAAVPVLETPAGEPVPAAFRLPDAAQLRQASLELKPLPRLEPSGEAVEAAEDWAVMIRKTFLGGMNYLNEKRFSEFWALLDVYAQIRLAGRKILLVGEARAVLHPELPPVADRRELAADAVAGAASYIARYQGFLAGLGFRLGCFFSALGRFDLGLAWYILQGRRLDPTQ